MVNEYYAVICEAKDKIKRYLDLIFQVSGDELLLELEHYNLLSSKNNCIESSTATGFVLEEFTTSKLNVFTKKFAGDANEIVINKLPEDRATINSSYDCFAIYKGIRFLINIKVEKDSSENSGVSAINRLYKDYVETNFGEVKSYLILKVHYSFCNSQRDGERKIKIIKTECYSLEETDFSRGFRQDNRNWSKEYNGNSGRLLLPKSWRAKRMLPESDISYQLTRSFISSIFKSKDQNTNLLLHLEGGNTEEIEEKQIAAETITKGYK